MKHILMIATGGTIASKNNGAGLTPALTSEELLSCVPEIAGFCDVTTVQPFNLDSTNIGPAHWLEIARECAHGVCQRRPHAGGAREGPEAQPFEHV